MCDNGIAYSLTKSAVQTLHLQSLSSKVNLLIDENPGLAHAEPDVSWSTEAAEDELMWSKSGSPDQSIKDKEKEGSHPKPCLVCTDSRQNKRVKWSYQGTSASVHNSDDAGEFLHRSLCVGLSCPDFEMGSLAFLRNPSHRALINYLTQSSTPPHSDFADDVHADFLSATMLLLKQRVWNLHKRMFHHEVNTPTPLPSPPQASARSPHEAAMLEQLYRWSHIAQDFLRQSISPGLQSGNTVVDERNFALL
jgi:mannosyltransferase